MTDRAAAAHRKHYAPPAVAWPLQRAGCSGARNVVLGLWLLALLAALRVLPRPPEAGYWLVGAWAVGLASGFLEMRHRAGTELLWDRQQWRLRLDTKLSNTVGGVDGEPCSNVQVVLDLQRILLLRVTHGSGRIAWIWLSCGEAKPQWHLLRTALYGWRRA